MKNNTKPNPAQIEAILQKISVGYSLPRACALEKAQKTAVLLTIYESEAYSKAFTRAKELRAAVLAEEAADIATSDPTSAALNREKMKVIQWLASVDAPDRYGSKQTIDVNNSYDIRAKLEQGRSRVVSTKKITDAQIIEAKRPPGGQHFKKINTKGGGVPKTEDVEN